MGPNDDLHRLERELKRSHKQGIGPLLLALLGGAALTRVGRPPGS
jgi:hypothetical protein